MTTPTNGKPASHRGVWYACGQANTLPGHPYVYSGPMATYCVWHRPMAVYSAAVDRTYFVFGNADNAPTISYYDHAQATFASPVVLGSNRDGDAHRNPTLLVDEDGLLYVFYGAHGDPSRVLRSARPHDLSEWVSLPDLADPKGTYPQPWQLLPGELFVTYRHAPGWRCRRSRDRGETWEEPLDIVCHPQEPGFPSMSVYGISVAATGPYPRRVHFTWSRLGGGTPEEIATKHLWARRYNVYYACSEDGGHTWQRSDRTPYELPITEETAEKLYDCGEHGVWLKDIQLDSAGHPLILFCDADTATYESALKLLRHDGDAWHVSQVAVSDHMYDDGAVVALPGKDLRVYAPTTAVQPLEDGGEIEEWVSPDGGDTWTNSRHITSGSVLSHNCVKTVHGHEFGPGDLRILWSYGDSNFPPQTRDVDIFCFGEGMTAPRRVEFPMP